MSKKDFALTRRGATGDPFSLFRHVATDVERLLDQAAWPSFRFPVFGTRSGTDESTWIPEVDVFEKDNRLVTKIDLPGLKKEDVKVEVADGHLAISGERKSEVEEKKEQFYRCEREYGSFYRAVPLPEGVKLEDVRATFADGVLEVSVPLPVKAKTEVRKIEIEGPSKAPKAA